MPSPVPPKSLSEALVALQAQLPRIPKTSQPRVLLDADGDVWVAWPHDPETFVYVSRHGHPSANGRTEAELTEDDDRPWMEAEWINA